MTRLGLIIAAAGIALAVVFIAMRPASYAPAPVAVKPAIGGPFTLTDHTGRRVTDKDFGGRYLLIYFGYTFCPDVCPTSLTAISSALDLMGNAAKFFQPVFITVDPERDTQEILNDYVAHFHDSLTGLTGTADEIAAVAKAYRAFYQKAPATPGGTIGKDDYLMNHISLIYVMGPDGKFITSLPGHTTPADKIAKRLTALLGH